MLDSERTFKIKVRLIPLLFKGSWILTYFWHSSWHYFGYIFRKITQKYSFKGQYSWRRRIISSNWNLLKNYEKYFLFHLNKLNTSFANQILHILCIFTKPNVWCLWSLKILAIKRWFCSVSQKFYRAAILWWVNQKTFCRHFFWRKPSKYCIAKFTAIFVCLLLSWSRRYSMKWSSNFDEP